MNESQPLRSDVEKWVKRWKEDLIEESNIQQSIQILRKELGTVTLPEKLPAKLYSALVLDNVFT